MPSYSKEDLLDVLYDKYQTLYDFLQELNSRLGPDDRPDFDGLILNTQLEIERVREAYDFVDLGRTIPFPSDAQVAALAEATGALQRIVGINKAITDLATKASTLIKTWPISRGG